MKKYICKNITVNSINITND